MMFGGISQNSVAEMSTTIEDPDISLLYDGRTAASKNACLAAQWLTRNFEIAEDCHIAREVIFQQYGDACESAGISPMNAASFGKVIRSVFSAIATRRLGTRGNSKYFLYFYGR
jgi:hypothetical protein